MASAYSTPQVYSEYVPQLPMETIMKGLQYKQQKYDANRERVQNFLNVFSSIELAKGEDQEHFYNNLQQLKGNIDKMGMGDLSIDGSVEKIAQYIGYAADDDVIRGIAGTKVKNKIEEEAEWTRKNDPDKYDDRNFAFSMKGINAWMQDGTVGSDYRQFTKGITNYIPYTDMTAEAIKVLDKIDPTISIIPKPYGDGYYYYDETHEQITSTRIINTLDAALFSNPKISQQMGINSWATYEQASDEELAPLYRDRVVQETSSLTEEINALTTEMQTKPVAPKEEYEAKIKSYQKRIDKNNSILSTPEKYAEYVTNNKSDIALKLYKDEFTNGMVSMYAQNNVTASNRSQFELARYKAELDKKSALNNNQKELALLWHDDPSKARAVAATSPELTEWLDGFEAQMAFKTSTNQALDLSQENRQAFDDMQALMFESQAGLNTHIIELKEDYGNEVTNQNTDGSVVMKSKEELMKIVESADIDDTKRMAIQNYLNAYESNEDIQQIYKDGEEKLKDELVRLTNGSAAKGKAGQRIKKTKDGDYVIVDNKTFKEWRGEVNPFVKGELEQGSELWDDWYLGALQSIFTLGNNNKRWNLAKEKSKYAKERREADTEGTLKEADLAEFYIAPFMVIPWVRNNISKGGSNKSVKLGLDGAVEQMKMQDNWKYTSTLNKYFSEDIGLQQVAYKEIDLNNTPQFMPDVIESLATTSQKKGISLPVHLRSYDGFQKWRASDEGENFRGYVRRIGANGAPVFEYEINGKKQEQYELSMEKNPNSPIANLHETVRQERYRLRFSDVDDTRMFKQASENMRMKNSNIGEASKQYNSSEVKVSNGKVTFVPKLTYRVINNGSGSNVERVFPSVTEIFNSSDPNSKNAKKDNDFKGRSYATAEEAMIIINQFIQEKYKASLQITQ